VTTTAFQDLVRLCEKLEAFKNYVHQRLDAMGIEKEPNGKHSANGCRIGDRLDLLEERTKKAGAGVEAEYRRKRLEIITALLTAPNSGGNIEGAVNFADKLMLINELAPIPAGATHKKLEPGPPPWWCTAPLQPPFISTCQTDQVANGKPK